MKKISTATRKAIRNFSQPKLTIGLDLGISDWKIQPARAYRPLIAWPCRVNASRTAASNTAARCWLLGLRSQ